MAARGAQRPGGIRRRHEYCSDGMRPAIFNDLPAGSTEGPVVVFHRALAARVSEDCTGYEA